MITKNISPKSLEKVKQSLASITVNRRTESQENCCKVGKRIDTDNALNLALLKTKEVTFPTSKFF